MYLLPEPREKKYLKEEFVLQYDTVITIAEKQGGLLYESALLLKEEILLTLGFLCRITVGRLRNDTQADPSAATSAVPNDIMGGINLAVDKTFSEESYELSITQEGIQIIGGEKGILYGIQTLRQILVQEGAVLPGMEIKDYPALKNRGFYHDVTRGRIPTLSFLKSLVDKLSFYKINQLQLYVEHSFLFKEFSEVWRDDTPLQAEEILELDKYCVKRNVELVPSLSCFGHLYKILRTRTYSHLCEFPDERKEPFSFDARMAHHVLDVSNEESFTFITNMIDEYLPLFSSKYFNICADETFDLGKGKSKELADKIGVRNLYIDFLNRICQYVVSKGKIPMFWGDIILGFPEAISQLPQETICLNWGYAPDESENHIRKLAKAGAIQYSCPGVSGWNELINQMESAYHNILRMCTYAHKYNAAGVLNTDWGDYGHINHPEFSSAGMIYGAAMSWNGTPVSFDTLNKAVSVIEYKDRSETFMHIVSEIAQKSIYRWNYMVKYKELNQKGAALEGIKSLLSEVDFTKITAANEQLIEDERKLCRLLKCIDSSTRKIAHPYQIATRGIHIFNAIGEIVGQLAAGNLSKQSSDLKLLATRLEYWHNRYKELWRTVSKESELCNISDVIYWYADFLRDL